MHHYFQQKKKGRGKEGKKIMSKLALGNGGKL